MKKSLKSIKVRMVLMLLGILAAFLVIFIWEHEWAIRLAKQQVTEKSRGAMGMYLHGLEEALSELDNCLATTMNTLEFQSYRKTRDTTECYVLEQRLLRTLKEDAAVYRDTDCLFIYHTGYDAWLYASKNHITQQENTQMKEAVREALKEQEQPEGWFFLQWEDTFYLTRILQQNEVCAGSMIQVETLLSESELQTMLGVDYLSFCRRDKSLVGSSFPCEVTAELFHNSIPYQEAEGNGESCMLFFVFSEKCGFYLAGALREQAVFHGFGSIQQFVYLFFGFVAVALFIATVLMHRWILIPLNRLGDSLKAFGKGNLSQRLCSSGISNEFSEVYGAFNRMAEQISDLKIGVYEEQMERQKYQLQYYKLQINPHFYINCLNVIYSLSLTNKNEIIRDMTGYLGSNLRYAMEERSLDFLFRELEYVENFINIQNIRYHGSIEANVQVEDAGLNMQCIPPLAVQVFVENSIKYQVVPGELLYLWIKVRREAYQGKAGMEIEIRDSGNGFEAEMLALLQKGGRIIDEKGEHYGIHNVCQRLRLIYNGCARVLFSNHPGGGACVKMWIPLENERREKKENAAAIGG